MFNTTAKFNKAIYSENRKLAIKVTLELSNKTVELQKEDLDAGSLTINSTAMNKGFELGNVTASDITLTLNNRDGKWNDTDFSGSMIKPYCGVYLEDGTVEYVPMGIFIVDKPSRPYAIIELKGTDRLVLFDRPLDIGKINVPTSNLQLLKDICRLSNVPLKNGISILNGDNVIKSLPEKDYTYRDALAEIALMAGGFASIDRYGVLDIVPVKGSDSVNPEKYHELTTSNRVSHMQLTDQIVITGLKNKRLKFGTDDYAIEVEELKLLAEDKEKRVLDNVFNQIKGFTYIPFDAKYFGNPAIDVGDYILNKTRQGETKGLVTFHSFKYGGNCTLKAEGKSKQENDFRNKNQRILAQALTDFEEKLDVNLTDRELAQTQLTQVLGMALGAFSTQVKNDDNSVITYWHNKPNKDESTIIWKFNGEAIAVSNDGGKTWKGYDATTSNLIVNYLSALKISADEISVGEESSKRTLNELLEELNANNGDLAKRLEESTNALSSAENKLNELEESYKQTLLSSEATEAEINNQLANLEEARAVLEQAQEETKANLQEVEELAKAVTRTFNTDALGRPVISKADSDVKLVLDNDKLSFVSQGSELAYFGKDKAYISALQILQNLNIGKYTFEVEADGGFSIRWID